MKKLICIMLIACMCFSVCFSDGTITAQLNTADGSISVSGNLGESAGGVNAFLTVYKSGFAIEDTDPAVPGFAEDIVYTAQSATDENGGFSFGSFVTGGESGKYTVRVTESKNGAYVQKDIHIASENDMNSFAENVKNSDAKALRMILDNETENPVVGLDMTLYEILNDAQRDKACALIAEKSSEATGIQSVYGLINECCAETGILNFSSKEALLGYFRDDIHSFTDEEKDAVLKVLKAETCYKLSTVRKFLGMPKDEQLASLGFLQQREYSGFTDFYNDLNAAVIHKSIKSLKLWTEVGTVLSDYSDILTELDYSLYKNSKYKSAIDKKLIENDTVYSVSKLCGFINDAAKNGFDSSDTPSKPSTGGGVGGGGASSPRVSGGSVEIGAHANNTSASEEKTQFTDLDGAEWAKDDILYLTQKGILNGKTKNEFCPNDIVTREEFAKMLVLALNISGEQKPLPFADVKPGDWYYTYVRTAYSCGIITGMESDMFGTGSPVTRQDMAVMAARALNAEVDSQKSDFKDSSEIAGYADGAVWYLTQKGVISGFEDNTFRPVENCSRAQAAKVIRRLMTL